MGQGTHGKVAKLLGYGKDLTPFFRSATARGSLNTAKRTLWGDTAHTYQGTTQAPSSVAAQGLFADGANELQSIVESILGTNGNCIGLPDGYDAVGRDYVAVDGTAVKHGGDSKREDMVALNIEFTGQNGLDIGRALNAYTSPIVALAGSTAVDFARATAHGGVAHLVVSALATGTMNCIVEDSADGSTGWATIATFLGTTAPGDQRIRLAQTAAVRRYIRYTTTGTFTGCTGFIGFCKNAD